MYYSMHNSAGDLTVLGWWSFALYLTAALLSLRAAAIVRSQDPAALRGVWLWLGAVLAALGLNKLLNLQTLLIDVGRHFAGWMHLSSYRLELYAAFFLVFLSGVIALLALLLFRWRACTGRFIRQLPLAATGSLIICVYIVTRTASIVHVEQMVGARFHRIPFLWMFETGGLTLIIVQALGQRPITTGTTGPDLPRG